MGKLPTEDEDAAAAVVVMVSVFIIPPSPTLLTFPPEAGGMDDDTVPPSPPPTSPPPDFSSFFPPQPNFPNTPVLWFCINDKAPLTRGFSPARCAKIPALVWAVERAPRRLPTKPGLGLGTEGAESSSPARCSSDEIVFASV